VTFHAFDGYVSVAFAKSAREPLAKLPCVAPEQQYPGWQDFLRQRRAEIAATKA
jgi:hypothetical protein